MLLIWAVFGAALLPPTSQSCFKAKEPQCRDADFAPGSNLAGEGFDITTMERKGAFVIDMNSWLQNDKSCTLCKNPYMGGQTQKLPVSVVDWRARKEYTTKVPGTVYPSSEALVTGSTSSIQNDWKIGLDIKIDDKRGVQILAGSQSKLAEYALGKTKKDKFSFTSHSVTGKYYSYRLSTPPILHPQFQNEFKSLPQKYDKCTKQSYFKLIDKFGTHYITKVTLGGEVRSVTSIKDCQVTLQGLSVDKVKTCLDVEASVSVGKDISLKTEPDYCKHFNIKRFSRTFSDRETTVTGGYTQNVDLLFSSNDDPNAYNEWVSTLPAHPGVISYSLEPLHQLLPSNNPIQKQLRTAIQDYIVQRALLEKCTCKVGVNLNPKEPCSCNCRDHTGLAFNCCPTQTGYAQVTITVIKGTGLYGDWSGTTDAYIKVIINEKVIGQTPLIEDNSPTWNSTFNLGTVQLTTLDVKLEVWDEDNYCDDLLGTCQVSLTGETFICDLNHGQLYYKVEVKCNPGLGGPSCTEYVPYPMDAQLEKKYVSRNALPIPISMLQEMGVLLDQRIPRFNQSNIHKATHCEL